MDLVWDLPGDVRAAHASALCGWTGVTFSLGRRGSTRFLFLIILFMLIVIMGRRPELVRARDRQNSNIEPKFAPLVHVNVGGRKIAPLIPRPVCLRLSTTQPAQHVTSRSISLLYWGIRPVSREGTGAEYRL